jgi:biopolymer transport protein ExbD
LTRSPFLFLGGLLGIAAACSSTRAAAIEAACDGGDANACEVLAAMHLLGEGVPKDEARASGLHRRVMTLRSKACSDGDKDACSKLGMAIASVPLDLPRAPEGSSAQLVFGISLLEDGQLLVNDKPVPTDEALLAIAESQVKANPDSRAVIKASANVKHGRVIRVLDILKQAGLTKIAFGVTPAASAAP